MSKTKSMELIEKEFINGYINAALWSEQCEGGTLHIASMRQIEKECKQFIYDNYELLMNAINNNYSITNAGHDFWFTRNHDGVGFWDRDLGEIGEKLTIASHKYITVHLEEEDGNIFIV